MVSLNENSTIMEFSFDSRLFYLNLKVTILFLFLVLAVLIFYFYINKSKNKFDLVKLEFDASLLKGTFEIQRNYENVEVAYKIYTELTTRKAALLIDPNKDVISEIYDSWYVLFKVTREELKRLSGKNILDNESKELVEMVTEILNVGLRPHLTTYQAEFRKWYDEEIKDPENRGKSPQDIQTQFKKYNDLIQSMEEVNNLLFEYCNQLHKFIYGTESSKEQNER